MESLDLKERILVGDIELSQYSYKIKNRSLMHLIKERKIMSRESRISNSSVLGLAAPVDILLCILK